MSRRKIEHEDCYVYVLLDTRTPKGKYRYGRRVFRHEPFYVGKGRGDRCFVHEVTALRKTGVKCRSFKSSLIRKICKAGLRPEIWILKSDLTTSEAHDLEIDLIAKIGRRDRKMGPLTNLTDGGDGCTHYVMPKKERQAISERMLNDPRVSKRVREWHQGLTPAQRAARGALISESLRTAFNSNPSIARRISKSITLWHQEMSVKKKTAWKRNIGKTLEKHYSDPEVRAAMRSKLKTTWSEMSPAEVARRTKHLRCNSKESEAKRVSKISKSWWSRTPEERAEINRRRSASIRKAKALRRASIDALKVTRAREVQL